MSKLRAWLTGLLAVVFAILAAIIWSAHKEITGSRSRLIASQTNNDNLKGQLAEAKAELHPTSGATVKQPSLSAAANLPTKSSNLADGPEYQNRQGAIAKQGLDDRYGPLFRKLSLTPEKLDQLKELMVEKMQSGRDALTLALRQGFDPKKNPEAFSKAITQAIQSIDQQIQELLTDAECRDYQQYQETLPDRMAVSRLQQSLTFSSNPLSDEQSEQLLKIFETSYPHGLRMDLSEDGPLMGSSASKNNRDARVTAQIIDQARGILSQPQLQALIDLEQTQEAEEQLQRKLRAKHQRTN